MKALRFAWLNLWREWKAGEHAVLGLALLVAVVSLTAVGFFTSRVSRAVAEQAGEVLAADLRLRSGRPLDGRYLHLARERGLSTAELQSFPSVVLLGEASTLAAIRAVSEGYPLRGRLKIADQPFGEAYETATIPASGEVWAEARLLAMLGAGVGTRVTVGRSQLVLGKVLDYRPDQGSQFVDLAPTLIMNLADLPATGLIQPGSRVSYFNLFAGPAPIVAAFKEEVAALKHSSERLVDIADASPQIRSSVDRAGSFLGLTGLVSVLLSAVAVAMAARRYASRHLDTAALMKSMGASQRLVLGISVLELALLGLIAGIVGTALGYVTQMGLAWMLRDLVLDVLPPPAMGPAVLGLITPVAVLTGFALPPLLQLKRVPPARVLRRDMSAPPLRYATVYGLAAAVIVLLMFVLVRDALLVSYVLAGALATVLALYGTGWLLVRGIGRVRGGVGVAWRYGIANVARRGRDSIVQIVAFGLGLMVLLLLAVVRDDLLQDWRASLPEDAPNQFLINIRPEQSDQVRSYFESHGIAPPQMVPMVRARLASINDRPVQEIEFRNDRGREDRAREFIEREANLTWSAEMQTGNKLVAGSWWKQNDGGGARVSVEKEIVEALDLKLGDTVTYDVAGELVSATVTSVREVQWESFRPNFFMVFSPGVLEGTAGTYITSVHLQPEQRPMLGEFYRRFPEVTVIDIDAILSQVRGVMDKASLAVQYVFLFAVLAGVTVLLAAIQATRDERRYESAMLRTLGASRKLVLQGVAAEFIVLGLLAGTLAASGATVIGYYLATEVFNLRYSFDAVVWAVGLLSGAALIGITGTLATRSVVSHPPIATLRGR